MELPPRQSTVRCLEKLLPRSGRCRALSNRLDEARPELKLQAHGQRRSGDVKMSGWLHWSGLRHVCGREFGRLGGAGQQSQRTGIGQVVARPQPISIPPGILSESSRILPSGGGTVAEVGKQRWNCPGCWCCHWCEVGKEKQRRPPVERVAHWLETSRRNGGARGGPAGTFNRAVSLGFICLFA